MTVKFQSHVLRKLAEIRSKLEAAQLLVETSHSNDSPNYAGSKAQALAELRRASEIAETLVTGLGDVPAPTRH